MEQSHPQPRTTALKTNVMVGTDKHAIYLHCNRCYKRYEMDQFVASNNSFLLFKQQGIINILKKGYWVMYRISGRLPGATHPPQPEKKSAKHHSVSLW